MVDPYSALSPRTPELLDAWRTGFRTTGDQVERDVLMAIDAGLGPAHLSDRDLADWRRWRPSPEETTGSVYLDSTTVITAVRLLAGERSWLTPLTLWDLSTVAQRVVMSEKIYYTGTPFGDLRVRAAPFRRLRWELDETLARGQVSDEARRLLSAVRSEALKLTDLLGFGYEVVARLLGRVGRATPIHLTNDVQTLAGIARTDLPADVRRRPWWWFFRPELRFVTEMRTQSRQMTNAMPQVGLVFGLPPSHDSAFRRRFAQLASPIAAKAVGIGP